MEDIKGFIWVIAAIGFFIWRMVQKVAEKAKEAQLEQQQRQARPTGSAPAPRPAPAPPAVSFEELLAQMQRQNQQPQQQPAPAAPRPLAERDPPQEWEQRQQQWDQEQEPQFQPDRPRPVARFGRGLEKTEVEPYSQELPVPEAHSLEAPKRVPRRGSTLPRASTQHGQEDYWSQKITSPKQTRRTVNELLQNPANLRAAFVLSEILQRRF